jgi:hypothetical protein
MSFDYTGSFSGSFYGVISASSQVSYTQITNKPTTISAFQKNAITANNRFREVTYPNDSASFDSRINTLENLTDDTGSDSQTLSFNQASNELTITEGNTVDLSSLSGGGGGGGSSIWTTVDGKYKVSANLDVTGSIIATSFTGSIDTSSITNFDTEVSRSAAASGFGTGGGTSDFTQLTNVPSGLISSSTQITSADLDMGGNKVLFGNVYSQLSDLPNAASYHGMFAHVHATGKAYFAHGGNWVELANASGNISSSTQVEAIIDNVYISASAAASGFGAGGGETYAEGLGIDIVSEVISIDTASAHFRIAVSQSAASYGFGSGGGGGGGSFGDPPVIISHGFTIPEFTGSNAFIGQLIATDVTPGDTQTWAVQDSYSDNFFEVSTTGVVRATASSSRAMNTDNTPGSGSHPFLIKVTDGQNNVVEKTIYIRVTPNSAPSFRIDGVSGNTITAFTASLDESSSAETKTQYRVYVTDADSDALTIRTGSLGTDHFSFTIGTTGVSKYIDLVQVTSSLDYESLTSYSFIITASDANYELGYDVANITHLPFRVEVVDNLGPGIQNQSLSGLNENSSDGTSVGSITATDNSNPANTILYKDFTLVSAHSGSDISNPNITSSLGGTTLTDPTADPFQMNIAGAVTRKSSVFLNSDIANRYVYRVNVGDAYNIDSASALITIPIADDAASSIGVNGGTYYVHEGALTGKNLTTNSNGYASGDITFTSAVSQMWEVNSVPSGYVRFQQNSATSYTGSSVTLEVDTAISGNLHFADSDTVAIQITASETSFETTKQYRDHTLTITDNKPYAIVFTDTSANLNTNGARPSNILSVISFTEPQFGIGDTIDHSQFSFTDPSGQLTASRNSDAYEVSALTNLSGSTTYEFTASIADSYGNISTSGSSFTIVEAGLGTPGANGVFYVIESAETGDSVVTNSNGRTGTQAKLSVTYSPQYNSAAVASFTSSNAQLSVASNGNVSVGTNISGSGDDYPGTISSNITYRDQFDNIGSGSVSITLTINNAPTAAELTSTNRNTNQATNGNLLSTIKWTDTEGDALNVSSFTLTGTGASNLSSSYDGSNNFGLYANGDQSAGTISFTASIEDVHGFRTGVYKDDITIAQADNGTLTSPGNLFIIESATNGDGITNTTTGIGTAKTLSVTYSPSYGSPVAQNFTSDNPFISVGSSTGVLTVGNNISGSSNVDGSTITSTIGWSDQYGNPNSQPITISVTPNNAPSVTSDTQTTANLNTNLAIDDALLTTLTWGDVESDSLNINTFNLSGTNASSLSSSYIGGNSFEIRANGALAAGTYNYNANVKDVHGFNQGVYSDAITISQAGGGSLSVSSFNIIESALSGSNITTDTDGIGSAAQLSVNYSPDYGSQSEQNFATVSSLVHVTSTGILTIEDNVSGSYANGANFTAPITWTDQYGNAGAETITIEVRNNVNPSVTFASNETVNAPLSAGTKLGSFTISDTENDTPFSASISGRDASKVALDSQNVNSSSYFINAADNSVTSQADLHYMVSVNDAYGEDFVHTPRTSSIGAVPAAAPIVYIYDIGLSSTNYNNTLGYSAATNVVPSTLSTATVYSGFGFADIIQSSLGGTSLSYSFGSSYTATLLNSKSMTDLYDISESFGRMNKNSGHRVAIIIPSGSSMSNVPTIMGDGYNSNGYSNLEVAVDNANIGSGLGTTEQSYIHKITLDSAVNGFDDYIIISTVNPVAGSSNILLDIRPDNSTP